MAKRFQYHRNDAGSLLASTFIVAAGAGCAIFFCLALDPRPGFRSVTTISVGAALFLTFIALQRWSLPRALTLSFLHALSRNPREDGLASQYRPRKINRPLPTTDQANQPLSVDQLREIQSTSANTWVPSRVHRSR